MGGTFTSSSNSDAKLVGGKERNNAIVKRLNKELRDQATQHVAHGNGAQATIFFNGSVQSCSTEERRNLGGDFSARHDVDCPRELG